MRNLAAQGRTVLVSSHLLSEMALTADHLIVIGRGRLIADASTADFIARSTRSSVRVRSPAAGRAAGRAGQARAGGHRRGRRGRGHRGTDRADRRRGGRGRDHPARTVSAVRIAGGGLHPAHRRLGGVRHLARRGPVAAAGPAPGAHSASRPSTAHPRTPPHRLRRPPRHPPAATQYGRHRRRRLTRATAAAAGGPPPTAPTARRPVRPPPASRKGSNVDDPGQRGTHQAVLHPIALLVPGRHRRSPHSASPRCSGWSRTATRRSRTSSCAGSGSG